MAPKKISTKKLWCFAYEDGEKAYYPRAVIGADLYYPLHEQVVKAKHKILTQTYGFDDRSWEILACPATEAFWSFANPSKAFEWLSLLKNAR